LVKAGTSVGANYCEADCAESKKDFEHKLGIRKKESKESKHWLRMISVAVPELKDEARILWQEANELNLIFSSIVNPVVALNSAHGFTQPLPKEGWLSNQCRYLDQSKSDLWELSSKG
jgi:four helix bundle protein